MVEEKACDLEDMEVETHSQSISSNASSEEVNTNHTERIDPVICEEMERFVHTFKQFQKRY